MRMLLVLMFFPFAAMAQVGSHSTYSCSLTRATAHDPWEAEAAIKSEYVSTLGYNHHEVVQNMRMGDEGGLGLGVCAGVYNSGTSTHLSIDFVAGRSLKWGTGMSCLFGGESLQLKSFEKPISSAESYLTAAHEVPGHAGAEVLIVVGTAQTVIEFPDVFRRCREAASARGEAVSASAAAVASSVERLPSGMSRWTANQSGDTQK